MHTAGLNVARTRWADPLLGRCDTNPADFEERGWGGRGRCCAFEMAAEGHPLLSKANVFIPN